MLTFSINLGSNLCGSSLHLKMVNEADKVSLHKYGVSDLTDYYFHTCRFWRYSVTVNILAQRGMCSFWTNGLSRCFKGYSQFNDVNSVRAWMGVTRSGWSEVFNTSREMSSMRSPWWITNDLNISQEVITMGQTLRLLYRMLPCEPVWTWPIVNNMHKYKLWKVVYTHMHLVVGKKCTSQYFHGMETGVRKYN